MTLLTLIGYGFAGAVTFSCARHLMGGGLKEDFSVFKNRTVLDWLEISVGDALAIAAVLGVYVLTHLVRLPFVDFSWLNLVSTKDEVNKGSNLMVAGATIPFLCIPFVILLFLNLPRLAAAEEFSYREGTKNWLHAIPKSLGFGLMHMIVGVPLWLGFGLAIPGLWFTQQYFRGGLSRSTMAHGLYNMIIATGLLIYVVADTVHRLHLT